MKTAAILLAGILVAGAAAFLLWSRMAWNHYRQLGAGSALAQLLRKGKP